MRLNRHVVKHAAEAIQKRDNMEKKKTNFNVKIDEIVWDEFKLSAKKLGMTKDSAIEQAFKDFSERKPWEPRK